MHLAQDRLFDQLAVDYDQAGVGRLEGLEYSLGVGDAGSIGGEDGV